MTLFRILYWGLSYSVGLICITTVFLRYVQAHDVYALKLAGYLLPFGLSMASLSLMPVFPESTFQSRLLGQLALVGASLVVAAFPAYALCFDDIRSRRRTAFILKLSGFALTIINLAFIVLPSDDRSGLRFLTLGVLGLAIFIGMSWVTRGHRLRLKGKRHAALMVSLFLFFSLVIIFDFFREFIPGVRFSGWGYIFLPAFYAYLNIFLLYSHVTSWARQIAERDKATAEPAVENLKRYGVSSRETEVLSHLARGRTYGEIADSLCVSLATIKTHLSHLYEKTGTRNKVELINLLYESVQSTQNQPNA